jgi:hypothetical protein
MKNDLYEFNNLWSDNAYLEVKNIMMGKLLDWIVSQELNLGSGGGESIPKTSQRVENKWRI